MKQIIIVAIVLMLVGIPISASAQSWSTYEDPILQFSVEHPSTWEIDTFEDVVSFKIPDRI